jgi:DNA-binding NtrC family response regulator
LLDSFRLALAREFEADAATSTAEAERMLAAANYQVIVCDHLMPVEEALPFLICASGRFPRTHRILLTGYKNPELLAHNIEVARLWVVVLKPAKPSEIAQAIRRSLESAPKRGGAGSPRAAGRAAGPPDTSRRPGTPFEPEPCS